jgi:hypothetical protein
MSKIVVGVFFLAVIAGAAWWWLGNGGETVVAAPWKPPAYLKPERAYQYLEKICQFGPRPSGSPAIANLQAYLIDHFQSAGAVVDIQEFEERHPVTGMPVKMKNIIVRFAPNIKKRVLLCTHYDTRPFPDRDPRNPQGTFIGANDGGSGVALFQEITPTLLQMKLNVGVDLIMFDGEELIYDDNKDRGRYFLGSTEFATRYRAESRDFNYTAGILLDMIADKELHLYYERNSYDMARALTREVWAVAEKVGVREFVPRVRHEVRDDHLPLNEIAKIPTTDLIDFDYPRLGVRSVSYWHTEQDIPENCSGDSICKVATVLLEWIRNQK